MLKKATTERNRLYLCSVIKTTKVMGCENWRLKAHDENNTEIPLSTPEQLYNFLNSKI